MPNASLTEGVPSIPEFRPVSASVFRERAARLHDLAQAHAMAEYLQFAAALVLAQAKELQSMAEVPVPDAAGLSHCREHGLPPLSIDSPRHVAWQQGLQCLLEGLDGKALPTAAERIIEALQEAGPDVLERDAASVLAGIYTDIDPGRVPFIGAALQLHWARMALKLGIDGRSPKVDFGLCPVCGSPPVVSVVRIGGKEQGLRYLVCSLCASQWHLVRVKCSSCASTKNISYLYVEGAKDAVRAECCDECKTYLKIMYLDKDQGIEPIADDLATLALDLLVDEQGYRRLGPNLLLAPGVESKS